MATAQKKSTEKEGKSFLSVILFKYRPYWPLFIISIILALFATRYYLRTVTPQYETTASIMVKDEKRGTSDGKMLNSLDPLSGNKIVENEIEVLQSRTLMNEVVKNLHLYVSFFEKDKFVQKSAYTSSPFQIEAAEPNKIREAAKVEFQFNEKDSQVIIGPNKYSLNQFVNTDYGYLKFIPNKHFLAKTSKPLFFSLTPPPIAAATLLSGLKAIPSTKLTTVISLRLKDTDPIRGEAILNELINVYNKATISDKNKLAESTSAFVKEQLRSVKQELLEIEQKKQEYKKSQGAVDISTQGQLLFKNISDVDIKSADVNMQLSMLNEVEKYVRSKDNAGGIVPSTIELKDPQLPQLLNKLYETELTYEKLKKTTAENNPILISIRDQINKIKPSIMENIQSQRTSLEASKLNLNSTNNLYSTVLQSIPQKERELIDIDRQQAIKSNLVSFLEQRLADSELGKASNESLSDTRIVDTAQSSFGPVSPKPKLFYAVAFIFALAAPAGLVFVKEFLSRKILFRHEIESLTKSPIIGEISFDKSKEPLVIQEGRRTFIAEQFRRMRTSLGYLGGNSGKKKILVTSSLSGEGKSFVAVNFALSLALTDKKVILLELDLSNPSLSKKLNVSYERGVSNYLRGECEPEDIIKRTTANNNLFFLPAGPLPDNPSELLMSQKLKELLTYLEDIFDVIIIDSAPASLLSDAYVLSPMCDATLYVVKHKFTPKIYLERLDEENSANQLNNMRIVFNGIRSRGFTRNGYGYGYGYGYIHNNNGKNKRKSS